MASLIPYLRVQDAAAAIDFYKRAFGAVEINRLAMQDGTIVNAELQIGGADFQLSEESVDDPNFKSPPTLGGSSVIIDLVVDNVDAVAQQAVDAGAKVINPVADHFYGWRQGRVIDPFGHLWIIGTQLEDLSGDEMQRRLNAMIG